MTLNSRLTLTLLGTPQVHLNGEPVIGFISDKVRALLYYIAANNVVQQRSDLAHLFWPQMPADQALKNLRQALHNLQKILSPHLQVTRQSVTLDQTTHLTIDLHEVRQLLATGTERALQAVIGQATGELLAGFSLGDAPAFAAWLTEERAYLQQQLADAVATLAHHYLQSGQWQAAVPMLRQWLLWEPWREEVGQWIMAAQARCGDYNSALRTFLDLQQQVQRELNAELSKATVTLRAQILHARHLERAEMPNRSIPLVGRAQILTQIRRLFAHHLLFAQQDNDDDPGRPDRQKSKTTVHSGQLITITGLGGMGKTHLARTVAQEHRHTFFDGVGWVALAPHPTLEDALLAIAQAYHVDLRTNRDLATQIIHILHQRESLLVLDSGEHLPQPTLRHFVRTLLVAAPRLTILLTSRLPLHLPQEELIPLAGLPDLAASEQLFRQSATRSGTLTGTTAERSAIQQICRLVDGMPLAIQLAATMIDLHSCETIATQLHGDLHALQSSQQDLPERQRSIRAILAATWAERTTAERRALTKLTIFTGSFSRAAARQIAQLATTEIDHLCDLALLQQEGERFTIHELLRQYIQAVEPPANPTLHRQFRHYFLSMVADQALVLTTVHAATAIALIAADLGNVQQAWRAAIAAQAVDLLAAAWPSLATFYRRRGPFAEGAQLLQQAAESLQRAPASDNGAAALSEKQMTNAQQTIALICHLQTAATHLHTLAGNFMAARLLAQDTVAKATTHQYAVALVDARLHESHALRALGRLPEAQTALAKATNTAALLTAASVSQSTRPREELLLAIALERGQLAIDCGNVTAAAEALQQALQLARAQGNEACESIAACELGYAAMALAKYEEADEHLQRALTIARRWADTRQEGQVLARQARLYRERGFYVQWLATIETTLALCRRIGDLIGEARAYNELGIYHRQQGDYGQAQHCFVETLQLLRRTNDQPFETLVLQNLGALALICGRYAEAETHLHRARLLSDELAGIDMQCVIRVYLSWHAAEIGNGVQALTYAEEALALAQATARPAFLVFVQIALGGAHLALADWAAAQHAFVQAQQHHSTISAEPLYSALSGQAYAAWHLADRTTALALVTTVLNAAWAQVAQQTDTPFYIYWRCYQILTANADGRAANLLTTLQQHFQAQLARINEPVLRQSFTENVTAHRQLLAAISQVSVPEAMGC